MRHAQHEARHAPVPTPVCVAAVSQTLTTYLPDRLPFGDSECTVYRMCLPGELSDGTHSMSPTQKGERTHETRVRRTTLTTCYTDKSGNPSIHSFIHLFIHSFIHSFRRARHTQCTAQGTRDASHNTRACAQLSCLSRQCVPGQRRVFRSSSLPPVTCVLVRRCHVLRRPLLMICLKRELHERMESIGLELLLFYRLERCP